VSVAEISKIIGNLNTLHYDLTQLDQLLVKAKDCDEVVLVKNNYSVITTPLNQNRVKDKCKIAIFNSLIEAINELKQEISNNAKQLVYTNNITQKENNKQLILEEINEI
jgi:galactitol-specific phosphotransferase system IIB component